MTVKTTHKDDKNFAEKQLTPLKSARFKRIFLKKRVIFLMRESRKQRKHEKKKLAAENILLCQEGKVTQGKYRDKI